MHRWYSASGYAAEMASLIPLNPSAHATKMSCTPRFFSSFSTLSQNFARSFSPIVMLRASFLADFQYHAGRRLASISGSSLFVIAVTIPSLTSKPLLSLICSETCAALIPRAYIAMIFPSISLMFF